MSFLILFLFFFRLDLSFKRCMNRCCLVVLCYLIVQETECGNSDKEGASQSTGKNKVSLRVLLLCLQNAILAISSGVDIPDVPQVLAVIQ